MSDKSKQNETPDLIALMIDQLRDTERLYDELDRMDSEDQLMDWPDNNNPDEGEQHG